MIGAGPAGLSAARMFTNLGIDYDHFERHTGVGGLWDIDNPGTPMYESAHFISSRDVSGFFDFPMPKTYGDYPTRLEVLQYTKDFAETFGLSEKITFATAIESVVADGDTWIVTATNGTAGRYRAVVCATGTNWFPKSPTHPGQFNGEVRHSSTHRAANEFAGKRVLIVGLGNSGADIACDAAQNAERAFISVRRGYHIIPKHVLGVPADTLDETGQFLPRWIERPLMTGALKLLVGDVTRWGLPKPDHKLFESHPLLNSQLLHHLQHGDIHAKGDVERFDGDHVVFTDGSREEIDVVIYATGYTMAIPYVDDQCFEWSGTRPDQYLTAFNRKHKNLFTLGYLEVNSSAYTLFDNISNVVGQYLKAQQDRPEVAEAFDHAIATHRPDLTGGLRLVDSDRHANYVDAKTYKKVLARVRAKFGFSDLTPGQFDAIMKNAVESRQPASV
ncbi:NAD(P)-binding domain-containing protein [Williamsia sp. CHRR-6]|nr:NAD(P)-binding domain-containing protein [Williamsia sp. CHRR-6]